MYAKEYFKVVLSLDVYRGIHQSGIEFRCGKEHFKVVLRLDVHMFVFLKLFTGFDLCCLL